MLKVELHAHTADDPVDRIPYSTIDLIDRAASLGFGGLAITLHARQLDIAPLEAHARSRGVVLIPGVEHTIHGKHVLLLNFPAGADRVTSFEELEALKAESHGLVIAPHPFYPSPSCLGRRLEAHAALFDAVELNAFYTRQVNVFNQRASRWARRHGKPVVACSDVHRLWQLGTAYTLVNAPPDASAICHAIRAGRVEIRMSPITPRTAATHLASLLLASLQSRVSRHRSKRHSPATFPALSGQSR